MAKLLFQAMVGSENPTRACFPFLQALANMERGDEVEIALAGDGVVLIRDAVINSVAPVGWPPLKYLFEKVVHHSIPIYVGRGCAMARGVTEDDLMDKNARFITFEDTAEFYVKMDKVIIFGSPEAAAGWASYRLACDVVGLGIIKSFGKGQPLQSKSPGRCGRSEEELK